MIILVVLVAITSLPPPWGSSSRRRKAKLNPSLTLLPHRRPNDVSWEKGQWLF